MSHICLLRVFRCAPSRPEPMWSISHHCDWLVFAFTHVIMLVKWWLSGWQAKLTLISRQSPPVLGCKAHYFSFLYRMKACCSWGKTWHLKSKSMHTSVLTAAERGWSRYTVSIQILRSLLWFPVVPVLMSAGSSPLKDVFLIHTKGQTVHMVAWTVWSFYCSSQAN